MEADHTAFKNEFDIKLDQLGDDPVNFLAKKLNTVSYHGAGARTALEQAWRSQCVVAPRVRGGGGERKREGADAEDAAPVAGLDTVLGAGLGFTVAVPRTGCWGRGVLAQGPGFKPPPLGLSACEHRGSQERPSSKQRAVAGWPSSCCRRQGWALVSTGAARSN